MKSRKHNRSAKRSRWAHVNTPEGLRRRSAAADARREAISATLPQAYAGPSPGSLWQRVEVLVYVPTCDCRCDQHAVDIDGERRLMSATEIGRAVAARIAKRPSVALVADIRREDYADAARQAIPLTMPA